MYICDLILCYTFQCIFEDSSNIGISYLKIVGSKIVAARLYGTLEVFQLQTYNHGRPVDWNFTCAYRRTHVRTGSFGSVSEHNNLINQVLFLDAAKQTGSIQWALFYTLIHFLNNKLWVELVPVCILLFIILTIELHNCFMTVITN